MNQRVTYGDVPIDRPALDAVPAEYRDRIGDLFDTWASVRARNAVLREYYEMKTRVRNLNISIPESVSDRFANIEGVVGWCSKAVHAHSMRSVFDGYVFSGESDAELDRLVRENRMRSLYQQACASSLVYGVSALTVMAGNAGQPDVVVRAYSANQFCALWDKDENRVACGVVLSDVDRDGKPCRYVVHMPDAVLTLVRVDGSGYGVSTDALTRWACEVEPNPMGRPLMEVIVHDPDIDRPLGHSMLTPELTGIVDKAMRDVFRMEIGAEFYTFPQRYILGAAEDLFAAPPEPDAELDEDGDPVDGEGNKLPRVQSPVAKFQAYMGALLAITRDEDGDVPQVGQFSPTSAENFTMAFENDAQRFSGATNVPLAQLGVLSSTYTSSDALNATNDPLVLEVETMNRRNAEAMESVALMMLAVRQGVPISALDPSARAVQACFRDPSKPTLASRMDAWSKFAGIDPSIVGTDVFYEGMGLDQPTITRLKSEKEQAGAISALNQIASALTPQQPAAGGVEDGS